MKAFKPKLGEPSTNTMAESTSLESKNLDQIKEKLESYGVKVGQTSKKNIIRMYQEIQIY